MKLRTKYQLKAIITPGCWLRNNKTDPIWDEWLWTALESNKIEAIGWASAIIDSKEVWIENVPYGNGTTRTLRGVSAKSCSRATALYLIDQLKVALVIQRLSNSLSDLDFFIKYNINLTRSF